MLLLVTTIITMISILIIWKSYRLPDWVGYIALFVTICVGFVAVGCWIFFIGAHTGYFKTAAKLQLEQKRSAIMYSIEKNPDSIIGLASDISEYNTTVLTGRIRHNNPWFSNITYDFYDELEIIEVDVGEEA